VFEFTSQMEKLDRDLTRLRDQEDLFKENQNKSSELYRK
jgi:hypothetical protein